MHSRANLARFSKEPPYSSVISARHNRNGHIYLAGDYGFSGWVKDRGHQAALPELQPGLSSCGMDGIGQFFKSGHIFILSNGKEGFRRRGLMHGSCFYKVDACASFGPGRVIVNELLGHITVISHFGDHAGDHGPVFQVQSADPDWRKEMFIFYDNDLPAEKKTVIEYIYMRQMPG